MEFEKTIPYFQTGASGWCTIGCVLYEFKKNAIQIRLFPVEKY